MVFFEGDASYMGGGSKVSKVCVTEKILHRLQSRPIEMRDAVSQPSLDIEESYFSKNILFFYKNDFSFYYLKL